MKPTIFINIESHELSNPIAMVFGPIASSCGAEVVEKLVNGDVEADIVVTNSISNALHFTKETEETSIILVYFYKRDRETLMELANRYSKRVSVVPYVSSDTSETEIVPFLQDFIRDRVKIGGGDNRLGNRSET